MAIFSDLKQVPQSYLGKSAIVGFVGFLFTVPVMMNLFSIANSPFLTEIEMLILAPGIAVLTGLSLFILYLGYLGVAAAQPLITRAALVPGFLITFECGLILSLLVHGADGPWRQAFEGLSGPVADGLISGTFWPMTFIIGSALGTLCCNLVLEHIRQRSDVAKPLDEAEEGLPLGT